MSGHEQDTDIRDSTPGSTGPDRAEGGMGVSSERVGHAGPGQHTTDGVRDTSAVPGSADDDLPQGEDQDDALGRDRLRSSGEGQPEGLDPAAGYPARDPRSAEKPYSPAPDAKHT